MALDHARITLANGSAGYIHLLSGLKNIQADDHAGFEAVERFLRYAKLFEYVTGLHRRLGEMPG